MKELKFQEEWLSAYLDDELTDEQRQVVEQRLVTDPAAQMMLDELRRVRAMVAQLPSWSGSDFKFTIPSELPGAFADDFAKTDDASSADTSSNDVLPTRVLSDGSDFEDVPRSLAGMDSSTIVKDVSRRSAADGQDNSRGSQRWMFAWLTTAASVLLMVGLGYFLWPAGGLMVSQLDRSVETAAPGSSFKKELAPRGPAAWQRGGSADGLSMNDEARSNGPQVHMPALAEAPSSLNSGELESRAAGNRATTGEMPANEFPLGFGAEIAGGTANDAASGNTFSIDRSELAAPQLSSRSSPAPSPSTALSPSNLMPSSDLPSPPNVALGESSRFNSDEENTRARIEAAESLAGRDAKSLLQDARSKSEAAALPPMAADSLLGSSVEVPSKDNAAAEPRPSEPQAKAGQKAGYAEFEQLNKQAAEDSMLRQQTPEAISLGGQAVAPVVIVARSSKWNEDETLQFAASQAASFYGDNALNYRQNVSNVPAQQPAANDIQSIDALRATGSNADVLLATVKSDAATTEALFNSVVTNNQFLPVEPLQLATANQLANQIVAPVADSSAVQDDAAQSKLQDRGSSQGRTADSIATNSRATGQGAANSNVASSNTATNWYYQAQAGRYVKNSLQGNSLVLFVTREEANRGLKELQQQGQVSSQVWRVVQRSSGQPENAFDFQARNAAEKKSPTDDASPSAASNAMNEQNRFFVAPSMQEIPTPADNDKVILMLNGLPQ